MTKVFFETLLILFFITPFSNSFLTTSLSAQKIYWTDIADDKIQKANIDGSNVEDVVTGLSNPYGISVYNGKIYWTESGKVRSSDLDGSNVVDLVTGLGALRGVVAISNKIYWLNFFSNSFKIQRSDLDGSNIQLIIDFGTIGDGYGGPGDLYIEGGKIYWGDPGTIKIQKANIDGSNIIDIVSGNTISDMPSGICVDAGKVYWTTGVLNSTIQKANVDGSNVETIVIGLNSPVDVVYSGGKIYWTDLGTGKIQSSNIDGSNVQDVLTGLSAPRYMAIEEASLPVELISFNLKLLDINAVALNWITGTEVGNKKFEVEWSKNGLEWQKIGEILGSNNSTHKNEYELIHENPVKGNNYYRLLQIDFDGTSEYSKIESILLDKTKYNVSISPTLLNSEPLKVLISDELSDVPILSFFDIRGQLILQKELTNKLTYIDTHNLNKGVYFVKIDSLYFDFIQKIVNR